MRLEALLSQPTIITAYVVHYIFGAVAAYMDALSSDNGLHASCKCLSTVGLWIPLSAFVCFGRGSGGMAGHVLDRVLLTGQLTCILGAVIGLFMPKCGVEAAMSVEYNPHGVLFVLYAFALWQCSFFFLILCSYIRRVIHRHYHRRVRLRIDYTRIIDDSTHSRNASAAVA